MTPKPTATRRPSRKGDAQGQGKAGKAVAAPAKPKAKARRSRSRRPRFRHSTHLFPIAPTGFPLAVDAALRSHASSSSPSSFPVRASTRSRPPKPRAGAELGGAGFWPSTCSRRDAPEAAAGEARRSRIRACSWSSDRARSRSSWPASPIGRSSRRPPRTRRCERRRRSRRTSSSFATPARRAARSPYCVRSTTATPASSRRRSIPSAAGQRRRPGPPRSVHLRGLPRRRSSSRKQSRP